MIGVILNPRAGFVKRTGVARVRQLVLDAVPDARIHVLRKDDDIAARCQAFIVAGATCIAAIGGDGTVGSVAAQLVNTSTALGVIPGGTLNHFARDVGVGRDVPQALAVLARGHVLPVDVATVNGRVFLNNSSIGLYARMVTIREQYEQRMGKWRAMLHAAWLVARRADPINLSVSDGVTARQLRGYLLFVGNNQYELDLLNLGKRTRLDAGELCCYILRGDGRFRLLPSLLRGIWPGSQLIETLTTTELTVRRGHSTPINVACDGEVHQMRPPLVFRVLPGALRVVVPKPPPSESREARHGTHEETHEDASLSAAPSPRDAINVH